MDAPSETKPQQLTAHRPSLGALTGLRFFAAFHVVLFHSRVGPALYNAGHHAAGNFFTAGHLAVPLFFVLSGFILAYTYQGQIETHADHVRFWQARFARIWPAYAASLLASTLQTHTAPPPLTALATLGMVQAWNPWNSQVAGAWNLVCWTLSVEAFFYLLFPALQTRLERLGIRALLLSTLTLLLLVALSNSSTKGLGFTAHGLVRYIPLPLIHLPEFVAGVCLGNLFLAQLRSGTRPLAHGSGLWTYLAVAATLTILASPEGRWTSLIVTAFSFLVYSLASEQTLLSRLLSTPILLLGGGMSYSIYLFQMPIKSWVVSLAQSFGFANSWGRLCVTALALIATSWLIFVLVENPSRRLIRRSFAAWDARRQLLGS